MMLALMRVKRAVFAALLVATAGLTSAAQAPGPPGTPILFEGARLIAGDGNTATRELSVSRREWQVHPGRTTRASCRRRPAPPRVDLTGKTVIPALIDAHSHIGYMKNLTSGPQNYTRDNILDHMRRFAYFGVAASQAMGSDFGEMPFALRDEILAGTIPGGGAVPHGGPRPGAARRDQPGQHAPLGLSGHDGGRRRAPPSRSSCRGRSGSSRRGWTTAAARSKKLTPELYGAIIDEAHRHELRVAVHATGLDGREGPAPRRHRHLRAHDQRRGRRAGRRCSRQHPNTVVLARARRPAADDLRAVAQSASPADRGDRVARTNQAAAGPAGGRTPADEQARGREAWERLARGIVKAERGRRHNWRGNRRRRPAGRPVHRLDDAHRVENMVAAGMTPAQVLVAATRTSARDPGARRSRHGGAGKSADFVVLDANPLDDITNTRKIDTVYLRGVEVDRRRLRASFMGEGGR